MQMRGNTILITGGGSGIGLGLARAFQQLGNEVIVAGRRQPLLDAAVAAHPGLRALPLDIAQPAAVQRFAADVLAAYPALNVVIHNAGIMAAEDIKAGELGVAEQTVATNLLGPIRLNAALMGRLLAQPQATIMTVTSGLAFVPMALTPTYCATKAAIHSYTQSLRYQLRDTAVRVLELVPPLVQTELTGPGQASNPRAMPLNDFIAEAMALLTESPNATEICVQRVRAQRHAERGGDYDSFFKTFNDAVKGVAAEH